MGPRSRGIPSRSAPARTYTIGFKDGVWIAPLFTLVLSTLLLVPYPNALPASIAALIMATATAWKRATIDNDETSSTIAELALLLIAFVLFTMPDGRMTQGMFVIGNSGILAFYLFLWITRKAWEPFVATVTFSGCLALITYGDLPDRLIQPLLLVMPIVSIIALTSAYLRSRKAETETAPSK